MQILTTILGIGEKNFPSSQPDDLAWLQELFASYGYQSDDQVPWWFERIFRNVLAGKSDYYYFDDTGARQSDMWSILSEIDTRWSWGVDDCGEAVIVTFPKAKMRVFVSREASWPGLQKHCNSCEVSAI